MSDRKVIIIVSTIGVLIAAIGVAIVLTDAPARGAADKAAVVSGSMTPATRPIPSPMPRKPVEQAPPVSGPIPGDGAWIVGRDIARGTYRTEGGRSCRWVRLRGGPETPWSVATPGPHLGPQVAVLGRGDVAFATRSCAPWRRIR